jgi:molecular chaperone GrpE (heat shock protein)
MVNPQDNWMADLSVDPNQRPQDFDFQNYLNANKDLGAAGIDTEVEALRHYQNYGIAENRNLGNLAAPQPEVASNQSGAPVTSTPTTPATDNWMSDQWYNPNVMPENFDWQRYVGANQDLGAAGIDTKEEAERHYFNYGQKENRSIGATNPTSIGDLSFEDYRAALNAYRQATGDDRVLTGLTADGGSDYGPVDQWIKQNYIPQGKFVTDYAAAKPQDTFELMNQLKTSNRPPEQLANIQKAWEANKDKPSEMRRLMQEYGVTLGDLSQATGETYSQLNTWVKGGDILGVVGFSVNKPGAYDKYKKQTTQKFDPNATVVAGPGTPESRLASYEASQKRAANTFDPVAYAKDPEAYVKKMREQGGLAGLVAEKAAPATPAQAKSATTQAATKITPVNFESEYNRLRADPNLTEDQTRTFLENALKDPVIKEKLGDKLQPTLDELNRPPAERMLGQIGTQQKALGDKYYQGVFADPKTMTDILEKKGVKSLADLGQKEKFKTTKAEVQYTTADGQRLTEFNDGTLGYAVDSGDSGEWRMVPKDQAKASYGKYKTVQDGENTYNEFSPLAEAEQATLKDGKYQESVGNVVINKRTGEELTDATRQLAYQSSSGGMNKKKNYLTVEFTKDGTPVLVATKEKAGLGKAVQDIAPLAAFALPFVLPGIGSALSGGLASVGGSALATGSLANAALTQGLISGGIGALGGQDFGKSFLGGAVSPLIGSGIQSLLPAGLDANAAKAITGAGTGVVKGALQGGDLDDLLKQGLFSGLTSYGLGEATKGMNLTPQQLNMASSVVSPLIQGKKVDPLKVLGSAITSGARTAKPKEEVPGNARGGLLEGPLPVKVPGNAYSMDPRMFSGIAANMMARSR